VWVSAPKLNYKLLEVNDVTLISFESPHNIQNSAQHTAGAQEMMTGGDGHGWMSEGG
jgi:hypothetical protein